MDLSVLFLAVPSLSADLHPSSTELLWITDVYGFLIAGALIAMGALGDRIGRRKVLLWGSAAFGAASILASLATTPEMLIAARGIQGIAGATLIPSTMSLLFAMFPHKDDRMKAIGFISAGFTSGAALGPILGGVLLDVSTWHAVFLINVPAMLAVLFFVPRYVPEFANPAAPRVDLRSACLLMLAVLPATYGVKRFARGTGGGLDALLIAFGIGVVALFLLRQQRIANPLVDLSLFRIRLFSVPLAAMVLTTFAMFGTFFFVSQYFQLVLGLDPLPAALWGLPGVVAMTLGTMVIVPKLATRYRPGPLMASGAGLMAVGPGRPLGSRREHPAAGRLPRDRDLPDRRRPAGHARQPPHPQRGAAGGDRTGVRHEPDAQRAGRRAGHRGARQRRHRPVPRADRQRAERRRVGR